MGISDRDYMRKSPEDDKRVESYETDLQTQEYGDFSSKRRRKVRVIAIVIIAALIALTIAGFVASQIK